MQESRSYWSGRNVFAMDLRGLALLRIGMASLLLLDLIIRAQDLEMFYTSAGAVPLAAMPQPHYIMGHLELFRQIDSVEGVAALFCIAFAVNLCLLVGFYSRTAAAVSFYFLASLHNRNIYLQDGGDLYLRLMLFWTIFLPIGARWSIDALRNPRWRVLDNRYLSLATAGWMVQLCMGYFSAGMLKSDPVWRHSGDALYLTLSIQQFSTGFARSLLQYPNLLRFLDFQVLLLEMSVPFILLCPLCNRFFRSLGILLLVLYHLAIASCLHLGLFVPICLVMLVGVVPTSSWDWIQKRCRQELQKFSERWEKASCKFGKRDGGSEKPSFYDTRPLPLTIFLASIICFIIGQNALTMADFPVKPNDRLKYWVVNYGRATALMQNWSIFAPYPFQQSGWYIVEAYLKDGAAVDLFRDGLSISHGQPADIADEFPNERWRYYFIQLTYNYNPVHSPLFLRYVAKKWNENHTGGEEVVSLRLVFMQQRTQLPGLIPATERIVLGTYPSPWLDNFEGKNSADVP